MIDSWYWGRIEREEAVTALTGKPVRPKFLLIKMIDVFVLSHVLELSNNRPLFSLMRLQEGTFLVRMSQSEDTYSISVV